MSQCGATTAISPVKHQDTTADSSAEHSINTPYLYSTWRWLSGWDVVSLPPNDHIKSGPAELSQCGKQLQAGRSTDQIPVGRRVFPHLSRPALGPTQPPVKGYRVSLTIVKWQGHGVDHSPHIVLRFKKEQSYTYNLPVGLHGLF